MNDRIKQFVKDHDTQVRVVAGVVSLGALTLLAKKAGGGSSIQSADHFMRSDGSSVIFVYLKNGTVKAFTSTKK